MDGPTGADTGSVLHAPLRVQVEAFLDDLSEEQACASLVASRTTLLGLAKHATFVEKIWFVEAVTGRPHHETGIVAGPDDSFVLADADADGGPGRLHGQAGPAPPLTSVTRET